MAWAIGGTTDVGTAGTAVQVSNTRRRVLSVTFIARAGNTGNVYVGDSTVSSTNGVELQQGQSFTFNPGSMGVSIPFSDFYVDAANNGDDVDHGAILWDG
jgi:hypothetical protein